MRAVFDFKRVTFSGVAAWIFPAVLFWLVLAIEIPYSFTLYFHRYTLLILLGVPLLYYLSFRMGANKSILASFSLTMLLFALTLSYLWTSGYSDNFIIGGLLPYKDAKNYYQGATQLLNGLPIRSAVNAVRRPLFSGFLSSMLLLTGQNLKLTLAILAQLAGIGLYLSARQVRLTLGALAGAIYISFLYFYFQFIIGYTMSESLGFISGCFAFALIWHAAQKRNCFDLLLGLGLLLMAVSARAGTFFIFPMLIIWSGWVFRGQKRFSLLFASIAFGAVTGTYFILNTIYPDLLGVPEGVSFGNFSYTLYGQVRGGIGWHEAINELGTGEPSVVYQAAWDAFQTNPFDFLKGIGRAYGDFFLPGVRSIFLYGTLSNQHALDIILWVVKIAIMLHGLYLLIFKLRSGLSILLVAGFIGIFLSIPFLPPIDGGIRFYASTVPFFYVLLAAGVTRLADWDQEPAPAKNELFFLRFGSISLLALTVLLPPVTLRASSRPSLDEPVCSQGQRPFAINIQTGSYLDLIQDKNASCGIAPDICYEDFLKHNPEMNIDDFYQELDSIISSSQTGIRIIPTINLLDGFFQYFVIANNQILADSSDGFFSGCATRIQTENQRIFFVETSSTSTP